MDSFLRLYKEYYDIKLWKVFIPVYVDFGANRVSKIYLWVMLVACVITGALAIINRGSWLYLALYVMFAVLFALSNYKAIKSTYSRFYNEKNKDRLRYFGKDFQYLRYCLFQERVTQKGFPGDVDDALSHLDIQIETEIEKSTGILSHPVITLLVAAFIAVLGVIFAKLSDDELVIVAVVLFMVILLSYTGAIVYLSFTRTEMHRLKEFRRFLFWLKADGEGKTQKIKHLDTPNRP